jgi:hypothetical protein
MWLKFTECAGLLSLILGPSSSLDVKGFGSAKAGVKDTVQKFLEKYCKMRPSGLSVEDCEDVVTELHQSAARCHHHSDAPPAECTKRALVCELLLCGHDQLVMQRSYTRNVAKIGLHLLQGWNGRVHCHMYEQLGGAGGGFWVVVEQLKQQLETCRHLRNTFFDTTSKCVEVWVMGRTDAPTQ